MDFYQIMRVMKLTMVLLTCFFMQVSATTYGQLININKKDSSIPELLLEIRKQADYDFLFDSGLFYPISKIDIHVENARVEDVLASYLPKDLFEFSIADRIVTIKRRTQPPPIDRLQEGFTISGQVVYASNGSPIPGVSVRLKGTTTASRTDNSGNFTIKVTKNGDVLVFTFLGLETKEVPVYSSQTTISVPLSQATAKIEEVEVVVQARKKLNTEVAVLDERKKSSIIQDAISAQQIERTASITTTQALQRVSGVTVTDDKYVAIRGLGDRSVIGQLNGVRLASSNPDRSTLPLDLVPATLLDNITVYKTVTPDKPADAAAGIVELKTKSVPDKQVLEFVAQTGTNSEIGIGGTYNSFWNSEYGAFGAGIKDKNLRQDFKDLSLQYAGGLKDIQNLIINSGYNVADREEVQRINSIMQSFDPVLTTERKRAPINQLYSLSFGNSYSVFKKHKLGVILGRNYYKRIQDIANGELNQYSIFQGILTGNPSISSPRGIPNFTTPNTLKMGQAMTLRENTGIETLNYGVLGGLTYRFNPRHEISFQYLGSWGAENEGTYLNGQYNYSGLFGEVAHTAYSLKQTERNLQTFNLQGEHKFFQGTYSPRLSYNLATSNSFHNNPDSRFIQLVSYTSPDGGWYMKPGTIDYHYSKTLYALPSGYVNGFGPYGLLQAEPNGRRWRTMEETNYNYKADLEIPFPFLQQKQIFKIGGNYLNRDRSFDENVMFLPGSNFTTGGEYPLYQVEGQLDRLVSSEIVGIKNIENSNGEGDLPQSGFLYNTRKSPNNYKGYYETRAFYGMVDLNLREDLRLTGGVRFEQTDIQSTVDTVNVYVDPALSESTGITLINPNSKYKTNYMPYYSVNATYVFKENMNFRLAFNTALARPELRELTNVFEFDVYQMGLVVGNRNLVNQKTENIDFRWEWFTNPGEVLAISAFGKRLNNQLVKVYSLRTEGVDAKFQEFPTIQFQNDPNTGYVWGLELEAVQNLGKFHEAIQHFNIGANVLMAQSEVKKTEERLLANRIIDRYAAEKSPIFEQAPYSINTWINYERPGWGTNLTATFNMVGERLVQINLTGEPDLYSRPAPTLDLVFSQMLNKRLQFKGYAKNILNPDNKLNYTNAQTGGKWYGKEYINRSYKKGVEIMVGFSYNLL